MPIVSEYEREGQPTQTDLRPAYGRISTFQGISTHTFSGHFADYVRTYLSTNVETGALMEWDAAASYAPGGNAMKRRATARYASGVALEAGSIGDFIKVAQAGYVDVKCVSSSAGKDNTAVFPITNASVSDRNCAAVWARPRSISSCRVAFVIR